MDEKKNITEISPLMPHKSSNIKKTMTNGFKCGVYDRTTAIVSIAFYWYYILRSSRETEIAERQRNKKKIN